jgi:membrane-bound lytic murein transglycosylase F
MPSFSLNRKFDQAFANLWQPKPAIIWKNRCCFIIFAFLVCLLGCDFTFLQNDLERLVAKGELVLITRNNAACYYEGPHGPEGFEYELAKAFADHLKVELSVRIIEDEAGMITALKGGQGDIIAAGLPFGSQVTGHLSLGPGYMDVEQQVVGHRAGPDIRSEEELAAHTLWATAGSARLEILQALGSRHPEISWQILTAFNTDGLLQMIRRRNLALAVVDSNVMAMNHWYYPELNVKLVLDTPRQLRWATDPGDQHLSREIQAWFARKTTRTKIKGLVDHYYAHLGALNYVDLARYRRRIRARLPKYRADFESAARNYKLDWRLVAAMAYQESHWNPKAKSYTGVRGIMMLTRETAASLGVDNRLDAKASIFAGTRYLARLRRRIGPDVSEPDRTLMALAAYNIGLGHVQDARILARRLGKPDHTWHGVRSVLPLLQQKRHYRTLKHRYARGNEAVVYVDRIRTFYKMLLQHTADVDFI